jgi:hypothetical protein
MIVSLGFGRYEFLYPLRTSSGSYPAHYSTSVYNLNKSFNGLYKIEHTWINFNPKSLKVI